MAIAEWRVPSLRDRSPGRLGALSGVLLALAFVALGLVAGGPPDLGEVLLALAAILVVTVIPGWIVGSRVGPTIRGSVLGVFGYALMAWLLWLPISVVGSTWQGVRDGSFANPVEVILAIVFQLAYAALLSIVLWIVALPLGVFWMVTFRLLRRAAMS